MRVASPIEIAIVLVAKAGRSGHCEATMGDYSNGDSNADWNQELVVNRIRPAVRFSMLYSSSVPGEATHRRVRSDPQTLRFTLPIGPPRSATAVEFHLVDGKARRLVEVLTREVRVP
jgi:hypothetical protein